MSVPILMYHGVDCIEEEGVHPYYKVNTSPKIFDIQMAFLYENDYSVISLKQLYEIFKEKKNVPKKTVVITFDDGFHDFYTEAFPILRKYGYTATVFLPSGLIESGNKLIKGKEHLSWSVIRKLNSQGIDFGSHSVTHGKLKEMSEEELNYEIIHSKKIIEEQLGESIESFSYPYAFPEENKKLIQYLRDILKKTGYKYGVTTRIGTSSLYDDFLFQKRIPMNLCDDNVLFKAKLDGYYDWLNKPQYLVKIIKRRISGVLKN